MEVLNISTSAIESHVLITFIPWLVGIVMGGGLGVLCGLVIRVSFSTMPALRRPSVLLPWRTFVMGLLMGVYSQVIVRLLGIGRSQEESWSGLGMSSGHGLHGDHAP